MSRQVHVDHGGQHGVLPSQPDPTLCAKVRAGTISVCPDGEGTGPCTHSPALKGGNDRIRFLTDDCNLGLGNLTG